MNKKYDKYMSIVKLQNIKKSKNHGAREITTRHYKVNTRFKISRHLY